jgi:hypothetical protein
MNEVIIDILGLMLSVLLALAAIYSIRRYLEI